MKRELWKQFWVGFWQGFTCWTLPIRWMLSGKDVGQCKHKWGDGGHPMILGLTTRHCEKCGATDSYRARWE